MAVPAVTAPRCTAHRRAQRGPGRDGRPRWHLPEPRLHPGEGVPRDRGREAPRRPRGRVRHRVGSRPTRQLRRHPGAQAEASSTASSAASPRCARAARSRCSTASASLGADQHGHGRDARRRDQRRSPATRAARRRVGASDDPELRARRPDHDERRGARPRPRARPRGGHRWRSDRLRVRLDVRRPRRAGDDPRGAAEDPARPRRRPRQRRRAQLQEEEASTSAPA